MPEPLAWPPLDLSHLRRLTDCTGIIQHAVYSIPDLATGYTTDDNARALQVAVQLESLGHPVQSLLETYLAFLHFVQRESGEFWHGLDYARHPCGGVGSEDTLGRALLACAAVLAWADGTSSRAAAVAPVARRMWDQALPLAARLRFPRGQALALLALARYPARDGERDGLLELAVQLGDAMVARFRHHAGPGWYWFEDVLTYANALLPHGLLAAYRLTEKSEFLRVAQEALQFLQSVVFRQGYLRVVGNRGWFPRGGSPALFDEQPIDAGHMVEACLEAYQLTGESSYLEAARQSLQWFHGRNVLGVSLWDARSGGVCDGLGPDGPNLNQGAESLLAYLSARLAWECQFPTGDTGDPHPAGPPDQSTARGPAQDGDGTAPQKCEP